MQYFRITTDETHPWGAPTYWFEIADGCNAERQIVYFSNGNVISYDLEHQIDEYDGLQEMVVDGDREWWTQYAITRDEFEREWSLHRGMNRDPEQRKWLASLWPEFAQNRPLIIEGDDDIPF